jgi:hypothetical protein
MSFRDMVMDKGVYRKERKRKVVLEPRDMVREEIKKQRDILAGKQKTVNKKDGTTVKEELGESWWDKEADTVTVAVRGVTYFNHGTTRSGNPMRLDGPAMFGEDQKWTKARLTKFINEFEEALEAGQLTKDTEYWHSRWSKRPAGSKAKGKATVTKKK